MFAWSQLDFSDIPVSISEVSLTSRQTWENLKSKRRLQRVQNVQEGKGQQKRGRDILLHLSLFLLFLVRCFQQLNIE
jgi:hypothetical protein